ncbi:hypothetical protein [Plastoroseomonas arctica]|uniref:Phasin domain-containing protein n=1 Tax=Plastoroseomonas arctica TaxID=1509237 RepID=A0AAF1JYF0_9PROT|nr:hypothetical protein [Plastoroseomonas arctica]MBR0654908.1 hypothetical protein [Plastoroseomonas arctica]
MDVAAFARFAFEASEVFTRRSLGLAQNPADAGFRLSDMVLEKQRAFSEGAMAAWEAVMIGTRPDLVAEAALLPAQRQVSENHRRLTDAAMPGAALV